MNECYLCGISDKETVLYEGIHRLKGVINVCRKCYFKDKIPLVEKKEINLKKINSKESVRERLLRISHANIEEKKTEKIDYHSGDIQLRDIVERNLKKDFLEGTKFPEDLIDNFNWVIMRKRRSLKITKNKMAEVIFEPVFLIENLEKGIVPKDYEQLIHKVEGYLGIKIFKNKKLNYQDILTESKVPSGILISDLQKEHSKEKEEYLDASNLNLEKINDIYGVPNEKFSEKGSKKNKDENLDDEDISKLVWGK